MEPVPFVFPLARSADGDPFSLAAAVRYDQGAELPRREIDMSNGRTSHFPPLPIDAVQPPGCSGAIGMTFCPGKHLGHALADLWQRDLAIDLAAIRAWGANTLVTLMQAHELERYGVADLGQQAEAFFEWFWLPIVDMGTPDADFEQAWHQAGPALHAKLDAGERIVLHCLGGLGRTGTIAARLLIERGMAPAAAIRAVRQARPGALESAQQEAFVRALVSGARPGSGHDRA